MQPGRTAKEPLQRGCKVCGIKGLLYPWWMSKGSLNRVDEWREDPVGAIVGEIERPVFL
jgi:hypothetical protein